MRVLVVDDEPLACGVIVKVLRQRRDIDTIEVAHDGFEALNLCAEQVFDLAVLDLHMPEMSGMELVDGMRKLGKETPAIIFIAAFDDQAIAAFEREAMDYILKPFSAERLNRALDNASKRTAQDRDSVLTRIMPQLVMMSQPSTRIALKTKGRVIFLSPQEIISAKAEGNYVLLQQRSGSNLLREQISSLEERLQPFGFVRIHRSILINSAYVESMELTEYGEYLLRLRGGAKFSVTRTYKKNLKSLAHAWIGPEAMVTSE
jgi:two-component system LytT family response regulator